MNKTQILSLKHDLMMLSDNKLFPVTLYMLPLGYKILKTNYAYYL